MAGREPIGLAISPEYEREVGLAQALRGFHERVEHDLQIKCRAAYDLEHVGGGGLLLQGFAQLA